MTVKERYALFVVGIGGVLVIASVLLMLFSGPKQNPWELTATLLPGEVQTAYIWYEQNNCSIKKLTEEQVSEAVHLVNLLEKADFTENSSHFGTTPAYGLHLVCNGMDVKINQIDEMKTKMDFDAETSKALNTDEWIIDNAALADYILSISGYKR